MLICAIIVPFKAENSLLLRYPWKTTTVSTHGECESKTGPNAPGSHDCVSAVATKVARFFLCEAWQMQFICIGEAEKTGGWRGDWFTVSHLRVSRWWFFVSATVFMRRYRTVLMGLAYGTSRRIDATILSRISSYRYVPILSSYLRRHLPTRPHSILNLYTGWGT